MLTPYYSKPNFTLFQGNCLDILEKIEEGSIDMIFADPPYNLSNGGFTCQSGKMVSVNKGSWDVSNGLKKDFEFHLSWIQACRRVLKPHGNIWISGTYHSIYQCGFALQIAKYHILNDIAWFKPNASPNLSCRFFTASHETLIWARRSKESKHIFNYEAVKDWSNNYRKPVICPNCRKNHAVELLHERGKQMRSVWAINTPLPEEKKFGRHPTQKPLELLNRVILASTHKEDIVLDPFTGSSTTGISAVAQGRRFIGIDLEKRYLDLSVKRFENLHTHGVADMSLPRKHKTLETERNVISLEHAAI